MNDTRTRRPSRARAAASAHARPVAEPALTSIPPQSGDANDHPVPAPGPSAQAEDEPRWGRISQVASGKKRWIAGGAAAAVIPAGPGLAWAIAGRPDAVLLVAAAALVGLATGLPYAVTAMYQARQETRRKAIEYHSVNTIAAAVAECIAATHTQAEGVSGADAIEEAKRIRASVNQFLANPSPAIATLLKQHPAGPAQPAESRPGG